MSIEKALKFGAPNVTLNPLPIEPTWILEGNPIARMGVLSRSTDGNATTLVWDCTAGRFRWHYNVDETIYVLEGGVIVNDVNGGVPRKVGAGETIYFPAGAVIEWRVENYIRKLAFLHSPMPAPLAYAKRGYKYVRDIARRVMHGNAPHTPPASMMRTG